MCGIVGYVGRQNAVPILVKGLERLEYRGYDSAGVACLNHQEGSLFVIKEKGKLAALKEQLQGVEISQISRDPERERHTTLIRVAAGASIPGHRHGGLEECFVLQGDVTDGVDKLAGGDYVRYETGSEHELSTVGGCLLLVNASLHDERLAPVD